LLHRSLRASALGAACVLTLDSAAFAQLRVVAYNMLDKPNDLSAPTVGQIQTVFGAIASKNTNGIAKRPDVIFVSEQTVNAPANLATILNGLYGVTTYTSVTPGTQGTADRVAFVYDTASVEVSSAPIALPIISGGWPRPTVRMGVRPVGYTSADATMYLYGMHLKASDSSADEADRTAQLQATRADLASLGSSASAIFLGDLNLYRASGTGYQAMVSSGSGQLKDPLGSAGVGEWNNNSAFASIHTQSTRTTPLSDGGATGGVDDRFDFQMVSNPVMAGEGLSYIGPTTVGAGSAVHSYRALGNNGGSFNEAINDSSNTAEPSNVLNALYNLSDHLPVFADYQVPARLGTASGPAVANVMIVGATATQQVTVRNDAAVTSSFAADELDYTVSLTGRPSQTGTIAATGAAQTKTFTLDTASPGVRSLSLNVTTSSKAAQVDAAGQAVNYTVLAPARPSLGEQTLATTGTFDFGIVAVGSSYQATLGLYNLVDAAGATLTAALDVDSASLIGDPVFGTGFVAPIQNIAAGSSAGVELSFAPVAPGLFSATFALSTSDQDVPGAAARAMLSIDLSARGAYAGDTDLNDIVDFNDLLALAQNYNLADGASWAQGDFDRSGSVAFNDLLALAQNYGLGTLMGGTLLDGADFMSDWALAQSLVPEPALLSLALPLAFMRRRRPGPITVC
jgi:hypothetical protein